MAKLRPKRDKQTPFSSVLISSPGRVGFENQPIAIHIHVDLAPYRSGMQTGVGVGVGAGVGVEVGVTELKYVVL